MKLYFLLVGACFAFISTGCLRAAEDWKPDVVVARDGSGQYQSLQEAISAAPMTTDPNVRRWRILVKPGTYHEPVYVQRERGRIHVRGEDEEKTVVVYDLNAKMPGPDGKPIGTFHTPTVQVDGDGMIWENITLANSAGPVGQALALRADGDRLVFRHCHFRGWQDTILVNRGRQYFEDCIIEGHVDFIFGGATAFFERCHIICVGNGYITAASTPKDQPYGLVFADCQITGAEGVKTYLGRPWRDYAKTVFLRTEMSDVVRPEGWHNWNKPNAEHTTFYGEFGSTGPGARGPRVPWAKTLTAEDAALYTPTNVLGGSDHWNPLEDRDDGKTTAAETSAVSSREASTSSVAARKNANKPALTIVLVGDSTVTDQSGWGTGFKKYLADDIQCVNTAIGGRSSKSFRAEGHWEPALALKGDYYLIQFGHNDQPGKGADRETDPQATFADNLSRYVDNVRSIGAKPILVTSLTRRQFDPKRPGKLADTLEPYAAATRKVAEEKHVPLVDLHRLSMELCEQWGPEKCAALNPIKSGVPDYTHLDAEGSIIFAGLVVEELRNTVPELAPHLRTQPIADGKIAQTPLPTKAAAVR